ncbi:MAG: hypothetical protein K9G76_08625 [Bacteroidales bacterium]|nr:hypothetical protein [Bacteroidales bacterium]MCF8404430.1 hypothetical protein [Bacteroidales bacterium]
MIRSELNSGTKILETTLTGLITIPEIKRYYSSLIYNKALPSKLKVILNSVDAKYQFDDSDFVKISESVAEVLEHFDLFIEAIIESSPYETALAFMYEKKISIPKYRFKVFSTEDAALTWLSTF